jgi:hypothetical protein
MSDAQFFQLNQQQWFEDFVDQEVSEIRRDTNAQIEIFEFDDIPF